MKPWRLALSLMLACSLIATQTPAAAAEIVVRSARQIEAAMADAKPGDVLIMADGTWTDQAIVFAGHGTPDAPITLRTKTTGKVILTGASSLSISGTWLVVDGLHFKDGTPGESNHVIRFNGPLGPAHHCRLTQTAITHYNPESIDTRYFWVSIYGTNNRVDHCRFEGQNHSGVTLVTWLDGSRTDHRIDANHFLNRPEGNGNGFETIRLGTSAWGNTNAHVLIENNLFQETDGEMEIISNKSNDNTFRHNTFDRCAGTLTLRHGHRATVDGNYFLGRGKDRTGGVRVIGEDHAVTNNYFSGLDDRAGGVVSITAAIENTPANGYQEVRNALVAHNTFIDNNGPIIICDWGYGQRDRLLRPRDVKIVGNLVTSDHHNLVVGTQGESWVWQDNLAHITSSKGNPFQAGFEPANLRLVQDYAGVQRPSVASPAIDAASHDIETITHDIDGQQRTSVADIGADELHEGQATRQPLTPRDVGPEWMRSR
ncbi:MAG: polysaccharide lyase 6 family protein [Planctomycetota bacterium]